MNHILNSLFKKLIIINSYKNTFTFCRCARKSKYFQFYFRNKYRRYFAIGTFLFFGFFLLMIILEKLSNRNDSTEDTVFNPYFNPNIRVNDADS